MKGDVKSKLRLTWLLNRISWQPAPLCVELLSRSASDIPRQKLLCLFQYARLNFATA